MYPDQFWDYSNNASTEAQNYSYYYYDQFMPLREDLLQSVDMTAEEAGFR